MINGWETKRLCDGVLKVRHGRSQHEIKTLYGIYPILATSGEIGRTDIFLYDKPSVLIGRKGTIDKPQYMDTPFWTIDTLFYTEVSEEYSVKFLYYLFCTIDWEKYNEASGVPSLSAKVIESMEATLPPLPEQRRIATVLSDTDTLIATLEKLIAKKRNIKQGAMHELLTGKRRLPGFSGEWVEKTIRDIAIIFGRIGFRGYTKQDIVGEKQGAISLSPSNINDRGINFQSATYISWEKYEESPEIMLCIGDVVLVKTGSTYGKTAFVADLPWKTTLNPQIVVLKDIKINPRLLGYIMGFDYIQQQINDTIVGGAIPTLSQEQVYKFRIQYPIDKPEQTAIAAILSDMDAEIDALTAKLTKLKHIKQGMMSELLTGRIRLAEQEAEVAPVAKIVELPKQKPKTDFAQTGGHSQQFDDAVMIAGIVNVLYSDRFPLGRKKVQKCLYLLRRHQDESTAAFKKKAAGPYADEIRYKGGEPIAKKAHYVTTTTVRDKGTTFARGDKISQALGYINSWGKQDDIKWVADNLKYRNINDLELLATVDMAICDLEEAGITVSVDSIKNLIATNKEWKAKLKRQTFSDANIAHAIQELQVLLQRNNLP